MNKYAVLTMKYIEIHAALLSHVQSGYKLESQSNQIESATSTGS